MRYYRETCCAATENVSELRSGDGFRLGGSNGPIDVFRRGAPSWSAKGSRDYNSTNSTRWRGSDDADGGHSSISTHNQGFRWGFRFLAAPGLVPAPRIFVPARIPLSRRHALGFLAGRLSGRAIHGVHKHQGRHGFYGADLVASFQPGVGFR